MGIGWLNKTEQRCLLDSSEILLPAFPRHCGGPLSLSGLACTADPLNPNSAWLRQQSAFLLSQCLSWLYLDGFWPTWNTTRLQKNKKTDGIGPLMGSFLVSFSLHTTMPGTTNSRTPFTLITIGSKYKLYLPLHRYHSVLSSPLLTCLLQLWLHNIYLSIMATQHLLGIVDRQSA